MQRFQVPSGDIIGNCFTNCIFAEFWLNAHMPVDLWDANQAIPQKVASIDLVSW
jgi:hypothetical protein